MANNASTIKRIRQDVKRRDRNRGSMSALRTAVKRVRTAAAEGDTEAATAGLSDAISKLDRAAQAGSIHANAAARSKSRLTRLVRGTEAAAAS